MIICNHEKCNMMFALISKWRSTNGYDLITIMIQHIHRNVGVLTLKHYNFYSVLLATYLTLKLPRNSNGLN